MSVATELSWRKWARDQNIYLDTVEVLLQHHTTVPQFGDGLLTDVM